MQDLSGNFSMLGLGINADPGWIEEFETFFGAGTSNRFSSMQQKMFEQALGFWQNYRDKIRFINVDVFQEKLQFRIPSHLVTSSTTSDSDTLFVNCNMQHQHSADNIQEQFTLDHFFFPVLHNETQRVCSTLFEKIQELKKKYRRIILHATNKLAYESVFKKSVFSREISILLHSAFPRLIPFSVCTDIKTHPCYDLSEFWGGEYAFHFLKSDEALLSINRPEDYLGQHLFLTRHHGYFDTIHTDVDVIFPFLNLERVRNFSALNPEPIIYFTTAGAGTGRMFRVGGLKTLFEISNRRIVYFQDRNLRKWGCRTFTDIYDEGGLAAARFFDSLEYYQVGVYHWAYNIDPILDLGFKTLIQLRDPRDLITSRLFVVHMAERNTSQAQFEQLAIAMIRGDIPSTIPLIIDSWKKALKHPNAVFIRFEDVDAKPYDTYLHTAKQLGVLPNPFLPEQVYQQKMTMGIEQSLPQNNDHHLVRKGVAGAHRKWWSPAIEEEFNNAFGDIRAQLNYMD